MVKRASKLGQIMAEIFAVDAEGSGDSTPDARAVASHDTTLKELSKKRLSGKGFSKELHNRWSCGEIARSFTGVFERRGE